MRVLAIDTALEACSVAVFDGDRGGMVASESRPMLRGHAEALMPMVARVMERSALRFSELDRIAVTTGPGSFTGLRVGISAARGIALAAGKPAVGVTTLAALVTPYVTRDAVLPVVAVIDARHRQVYMQVTGPGGRTVIAPRLAAVQDAVQAARVGYARLVGSGADLVMAHWPEGESAPEVVDNRAAPDIAWVARLGAAATDTTAPPRPLYLRAPDAQPQDAASLPRR